MEQITLQVKITGSVQRAAGTDSLEITAKPVFHDVMQVIRKELTRIAGDTVLFTVLCDNISCMRIDQNAPVTSENQFTVVPVILGG